MNNIISLFSSRDGEDSFEARLAPHVKALYGQAWQYTGNTHDAEDLLQDLLLELYAKQEQMAAAENLPAWLNRCLYHRFIDRHRRTQRSPRFEDLDGQSAQSALAQADTAETACLYQQVVLEMAQLSEQQRAVISLHDISGFSLPELAEIMDLPLGTLKSHLHRARKQLKNALDLQPFAPRRRRLNQVIP